MQPVVYSTPNKTQYASIQIQHSHTHASIRTHRERHSALWALMLRREIECVTLRSTSVYNKPAWTVSMEEIPLLLHSVLAPPQGD